MPKKQFHPSLHESVSSKRLLGTAVALIVFFLLLMSVIRLASKFIAIRRRSGELKTEQTTLTAKQADLQATNAFLNTPEGTEESLRERYNYLKPGEQMIIVTSDEPGDSPTESKTGISHWWDELLEGLGIRREP